jgi:serine/threonine-protein kinase HipA
MSAADPYAAIERRLASRYGARGGDPFDLLAAIDCVGAVQLLPVGEMPQDVVQIRRKALTYKRIEKTFSHGDKL